jgi:hypothetical protein
LLSSTLHLHVRKLEDGIGPRIGELAFPIDGKSPLERTIKTAPLC